MPAQELYFSHYHYLPLQPVFPDVATGVPYLDWLNSGDTILAIAGIGNPRPFIRYLKSLGAKVKVDIFPDHHQYTKKDIAYILERYRKDVRGNQRIIVTTEKDAVRLAANPYYPHELKAITYYLPIEVEFDTFGEKLPIVDEIEKRIKERLNSRN